MNGERDGLLLSATETVGALGIARTMLRWSVIVGPLAVLTVWLALSSTGSISPEYTAEAALLLVGPSEELVEDTETGDVSVTTINPLQVLGGNLTTVARVAVLAASDQEFGRRLGAEGLDADYVVWAESRTPIIRIEASHEDPQVALDTVAWLGTSIVGDLVARQDELGAPESDRITAQTIIGGNIGDPDFGRRNRIRIGIIAVGALLVGGLVFGLEALRQWRIYRSTGRVDGTFGRLAAAAVESELIPVADHDGAREPGVSEPGVPLATAEPDGLERRTRGARRHSDRGGPHDRRLTDDGDWIDLHEDGQDDDDERVGVAERRSGLDRRRGGDDRSEGRDEPLVASWVDDAERRRRGQAGRVTTEVS